MGFFTKDIKTLNDLFVHTHTYDRFLLRQFPLEPFAQAPPIRVRASRP